MGSLYWQINDNWPVASWSSVDYFGRYKALHYMAMTFYNHVSGSVVLNQKTVEAHVQNETLSEQSCVVSMKLKDFNFQILWEGEIKTSISALSSKKVMENDFTHLIAGMEEKVFVEITFYKEDGQKQTETKEFVPYKYLELPKAKIKASVEETEDAYEIVLQSDCYAPFTALDLKKADGIFSDNYVNLTEKEGRQVLLYKKDITRGTINSKNDLLEQLQIITLTDSFE